LNARPAIPPLVSAERAPAFSDEALALQFAERHAGDLRFVAAWNKWLIWEGTHWRFEETLRAWDFARRVCREAATQCNKGKTASAIASAKTVYAIERLAHSDRRLAATVDQWDADPWLLNTPDGAIDLRSLAAWIDEACARAPGAWEPSTALFGSWSNWANSAGEHPGSIKRFSQALESRGFTRIRQRRGGGNPVAGFDGLRLFQEPEPSWNDR
jgi:phage/plasmid-associated DNA primase